MTSWRTRAIARGSSRIAPSPGASASRSCGGTRPSTLGSGVATLWTPANGLAVLRDDQVDRRLHVAVQAEAHLVLPQLLDRLAKLDAPAIDLHVVLRLERPRDVLARDRAEDPVLLADPEPADDRLVPDAVGQLLGVLALLGLPPVGRSADT